MSHFLKRIDPKEYKSALQSVLPQRDIYYPDMDCDLMTKKGTEYMAFLEKPTNIFLTNAKERLYPFNDTDVELTPANACYYLLSTFEKLHNQVTFANVQNYFGFDSDCPPDLHYSLVLLWTIEPKNPLFSDFPPKQEVVLTMAQMMTSVKMLQKGKALKGRESFITPVLLKQLRQESVAYTFAKFTYAKFTDQVSNFVKLASHDPKVMQIGMQLRPSLFNQIQGNPNNQIT